MERLKLAWSEFLTECAQGDVRADADVNDHGRGCSFDYVRGCGSSGTFPSHALSADIQQCCERILRSGVEAFRGRDERAPEGNLALPTPI